MDCEGEGEEEEEEMETSHGLSFLMACAQMDSAVVHLNDRIR